MNRASLEGRDLLPAEMAQVYELRTVSDRLAELREQEERKGAGIRFMDRATAGSATGMVYVRTDPNVYSPTDARGPQPSFFKDLLHAQVDHDSESQGRIERHKVQMRAAGTTTTGAGVVPPVWLFNEFAILQHGNRPWADQLRNVPIDNANAVNIGRQVTPGAAPRQPSRARTRPRRMGRSTPTSSPPTR
jgi:hypothetical protein